MASQLRLRRNRQPRSVRRTSPGTTQQVLERETSDGERHEGYAARNGAGCPSEHEVNGNTVLYVEIWSDAFFDLNHHHTFVDTARLLNASCRVWSLSGRARQR